MLRITTDEAPANRQSTEILRGLRDRGARIEGCSAFLTELLIGGGRASDVPSEHDLIAALRAGDAGAFETIVRREGRRMLGTARRLLGTDEDAEDAVQEAFLQAYRAIDGFNGEAKISTWLHRIVVNAALMKLRSRRRKPEQPIEDLLPKFDETGEWPATVDGWQRSADDLVESAECRAIVRRAIDRLPEKYRQVLMIRDIEGFDTEEAAAMLESTPSAVKVRLHRARQALRTLLERDFRPAAPDQGKTKWSHGESNRNQDLTESTPRR